MAENDDFYVKFGSNAKAFAQQLERDLAPARAEIESFKKLLSSLDTESKSAGRNAASAVGNAGAQRTGTPQRTTGTPQRNATTPSGSNGSGSNGGGAAAANLRAEVRAEVRAALSQVVHEDVQRQRTPATASGGGDALKVDTSKFMDNIDAMSGELKLVLGEISRVVQSLGQIPDAAKAFIKKQNYSEGQGTTRQGNSQGAYVHPDTGRILGNRDPARGPVISNAAAAAQVPGSYRMGQKPIDFEAILRAQRAPAPQLAPVGFSALTKMQIDQGGFDRVVNAIHELKAVVQKGGIGTGGRVAKTTAAETEAEPATAPAKKAKAKKVAATTTAAPVVEEAAKTEEQRLASLATQAQRLEAMVGQLTGVPQQAAKEMLEELRSAESEIKADIAKAERAATGITQAQQKKNRRAAAASKKGPDEYEEEWDRKTRVLDRINRAASPETFMSSIGRGKDKLGMSDLKEVAKQLTTLGFPVRTGDKPNMETLGKRITEARVGYGEHYGAEIPEELRVGKRLLKDKVSDAVRNLLGDAGQAAARAAETFEARKAIRTAFQTGHVPPEATLRSVGAETEVMGRKESLVNFTPANLQAVEEAYQQFVRGEGPKVGRVGAPGEMHMSGGAINLPPGMVKDGSYNDVFGVRPAQELLRQQRIGIASTHAMDPEFNPYQFREKEHIKGQGEEATHYRDALRELIKGTKDLDVLGKEFQAFGNSIAASEQFIKEARKRLDRLAKGKELSAEALKKTETDAANIERAKANIRDSRAAQQTDQFMGLQDVFEDPGYQQGRRARELSRASESMEMARETSLRDANQPFGPLTKEAHQAQAYQRSYVRDAGGLAIARGLPGAHFNSRSNKFEFDHPDKRQQEEFERLAKLNSAFQSTEGAKNRVGMLEAKKAEGKSVDEDFLAKQTQKLENQGTKFLNLAAKLFAVAPTLESITGKAPVIDKNIASEERRQRESKVVRDRAFEKTPTASTDEQLAGVATRYEEERAELVKANGRLKKAKAKEAAAAERAASEAERRLAQMSEADRAAYHAATEEAQARQREANALNRRNRGLGAGPDRLGVLQQPKALAEASRQLNVGGLLTALRIQAGAGGKSPVGENRELLRREAESRLTNGDVSGQKFLSRMRDASLGASSIGAHYRAQESTASSAAAEARARAQELLGVGKEAQAHEKAAAATRDLTRETEALKRRLQSTKENLGYEELHKLKLAAGRASKKVNEMLVGAGGVGEIDLQHRDEHALDTNRVAEQAILGGAKKQADAYREAKAAAEAATLAYNQAEGASGERTLAATPTNKARKVLVPSEDLQQAGLKRARDARDKLAKKAAEDEATATSDAATVKPADTASLTRLRQKLAGGEARRKEIADLSAKIDEAKKNQETATARAELEDLQAKRTALRAKGPYIKKDLSALRRQIAEEERAAEAAASNGAGGAGGAGGGGGRPPTASGGARGGGFGGDGLNILRDILTALNGIHKTIQTGVKVTGKTVKAATVDKDGNVVATEPKPRKSRAFAIPQSELNDIGSGDAERIARGEAAQQRRINEVKKASAPYMGSQYKSALEEDASLQAKAAREAKKSANVTAAQAQVKLQLVEATRALDGAAKAELAELRRLNLAGADNIKVARQMADAYHAVELSMARQGVPARDRAQMTGALLNDANVKTNSKGAEVQGPKLSADTLNEARRSARAINGFQVVDKAFADSVQGNGVFDERSAFTKKMFGNAGFWSRVMSSTGTFVVRNFTAGFVFGMTNALQDMIQQALKTETTWIRVSNAFEQTGKSTKGLRKDLQSISTETGVSLNDVYDTAGKLVGLFDNAPDLANATRVSTQLQIISDGALNANEAVGILASTIGGFGDQIDPGKVGDVLTSIQNTTGQNVEVTAEAIGRMSGLARELHITYAQAGVYGAQIAKLTNQSGGAAGEQFSRILSSLQTGRGRGAVTKAFSKVDGKTTGIEGALDSGQYGKVLEIMTGNWDKLTDAQKRNVATTVAGQRQAAAFSALMTHGTTTLNAITQAQYANGQAADRVAAIMNTLNSRIVRLQTNFQNLTSNLVRSGVLTFIGAFVGVLDKGLTELNKFMTSMNGIADNNPFLDFLRKAGFGVLGLVGTIWLLRRAIAGLKATMGETSLGKGFAKAKEARLVDAEAEDGTVTRTTRRKANLMEVAKPRFDEFGNPAARGRGGFVDTANGPHLRGPNVGSPLARTLGFGLDRAVGRPLEGLGVGATRLSAKIKESADAVEGESRVRRALSRTLGVAGTGITGTARAGRSLFQGRAGEDLETLSERLSGRAKALRARAEDPSGSMQRLADTEKALEEANTRLAAARVRAAALATTQGAAAVVPLEASRLQLDSSHFPANVAPTQLSQRHYGVVDDLLRKYSGKGAGPDFGEVDTALRGVPGTGFNSGALLSGGYVKQVHDAITKAITEQPVQSGAAVDRRAPVTEGSRALLETTGRGPASKPILERAPGQWIQDLEGMDDKKINGILEDTHSTLRAGSASMGEIATELERWQKSAKRIGEVSADKKTLTKYEMNDPRYGRGSSALGSSELANELNRLGHNQFHSDVVKDMGGARAPRGENGEQVSSRDFVADEARAKNATDAYVRHLGEGMDARLKPQLEKFVGAAGSFIAGEGHHEGVNKPKFDILRELADQSPVVDRPLYRGLRSGAPRFDENGMLQGSTRSLASWTSDPKTADMYGATHTLKMAGGQALNVGGVGVMDEYLAHGEYKLKASYPDPADPRRTIHEVEQLAKTTSTAMSAEMQSAVEEEKRLGAESRRLAGSLEAARREVAATERETTGKPGARTRASESIQGRAQALQDRADRAQAAAEAARQRATDARTRAAELRAAAEPQGTRGPMSAHSPGLYGDLNRTDRLAQLRAGLAEAAAGVNRIGAGGASIGSKVFSALSSATGATGRALGPTAGGPATIQQRSLRLAAQGADAASRAVGKLGGSLKGLAASGMVADGAIMLAIAALTAYFMAQSKEARLNQDVANQIEGRWKNTDKHGNRKADVAKYVGPSSQAYNEFTDETKGRSNISLGAGLAGNYVKDVFSGLMGNVDAWGHLGNETDRYLGTEGGGKRMSGMAHAQEMVASGSAQLEAVSGNADAITETQKKLEAKFKVEAEKVKNNKNLSARQKEAQAAMLEQASQAISDQTANLLAQSAGITNASRLTTDQITNVQALVETSKLTGGTTTVGDSNLNISGVVNRQLKDTGVDMKSALGQQLKKVAKGGGDSADVAVMNEKLLRTEVENAQANWLAKLQSGDEQGATEAWSQLQTLLQQLDAAGSDSISKIIDHANTLAEEASARGLYGKAARLYAAGAARLKGRRNSLAYDPDLGGIPAPQALGTPAAGEAGAPRRGTSYPTLGNESWMGPKFAPPTSRPHQKPEAKAKQDAQMRQYFAGVVQSKTDAATKDIDRQIAQATSTGAKNALGKQRADIVLGVLRKAKKDYGPLAVTAAQIAMAMNDVFTSASTVAQDMQAQAAANLALVAAGHWGETQQAMDAVAAAALAERQANANGDKAGATAAATQRVQAEHSAAQLKEQQRVAAAQAQIARIPQKDTKRIHAATMADLHQQLKFAERYGKDSTQYQGILQQIYSEEQSNAAAAKSTGESIASAQASLAQAIAEAHGDARAAARAGIRIARIALAEARATGTKADVLNAQAQLVQAHAAYNQSITDFVASRVAVAVAIADAAGNTVKSAQLQLHGARLALAAARRKAGGRATAEVNEAKASAIQARAAARDAVLQDRLDTIDFNLQMNKITQGGAIAALQHILKTANLTKQQRRDLLLKIKGMKDEIANDQWNFADIKMPTPYEMKRYVAAEKAHRNMLMQSTLDNHAPTNGATTTVHNNETTIQINGADTAKVRRIVEEVVGGSTKIRTTQARRR